MKEVEVKEYDGLTAYEMSRLIASHKISPVELVNDALDRLDRIDSKIHAFVTITPEFALSAARRAEAEIMRGQLRSPIHGIPISVKDNIPLEGFPLTFGSRTMRDSIAPLNGPATERLIAAGSCIVGKTAMTEFGCKSASYSPLTGATRNPWDLSKSSGGSSGGCAAAVAAGIVPFSVGTDGGGSLRVPSSFCSVFGFKPQLGRVPVWPEAAAPTMLHIGPIARTVRDSALLLDVLSGYDPRDANSQLPKPTSFVASCGASIAGWSIAWSPTLGYGKPDEEILSIVKRSTQVFEDLGCIVEEIDDELDNPYLTFFTEFAPGAAKKYRNALERSADLIDPDVADLLIQTRHLTDSHYAEARTVRDQYRNHFKKLFQRYRLLLTPTLPVAAFDAELSRPPDRPETSIVEWPTYTSLHNLTGNPAASVPVGRTSRGLPVGLQIIARPNTEADIFSAACALEMAQPWARPPM